jgi:hypothetical protein
VSYLQILKAKIFLVKKAGLQKSRPAFGPTTAMNLMQKAREGTYRYYLMVLDGI